MVTRNESASIKTPSPRQAMNQQPEFITICIAFLMAFYMAVMGGSNSCGVDESLYSERSGVLLRSYA